MSVPQITVDLTPPSIGQSVEEFNSQAHIWTANLSDGFKPQANALATFVNQKAIDANDDATAAQTARTQAQTASGTASSDASTASAAATNAGNSASTASTKAGEASADATAALASKNAAAASQTAAAGSATAAGNSATAAAGSATTASTAATNAGNSASTASTAATNAGNSATTANTKAGEASASASAALASKNAAATSESNAAGSASAAAVSQAAAHQAKLDAEAAAEQAAGGGEPTILPGNSTQYWRGDKTWQTLDKPAVGLGNVDNVSAANLRDRSTHTGTQTISSVSGLQTALDGKAAVGSTAGADLGTASAGSATTASRSDHVHKLPTAAEVGAAPSAHVGAGGTAHANATTSVDGFMSSADKTKLNGVASGATANATDAQLRDRSTHTGTQAQSTVTNLTTDLAARVNRQDSYATVSSGVINLGLETELYHITVSGNVTVSVSNAPTTSRVVKRLIVQYSSGVVTWPASFKLPTPMPTFAAGKAYVFSIEQSPNSGVYFLVPGPEYTYP